MRRGQFSLVVVLYGAVHEMAPHLAEESPLKGLGEGIAAHVLGPLVSHLNFPTIDLVLHKEEPVVDVLGPLGAGPPAVLGKKDRGLVVLEKDVVCHFIPLGLNEVQPPHDARESVIDPD
jgi:hypothetical protein